MQRASFVIGQSSICVECAIALRRFLAGLDGVRSIEDVRGLIIIHFDENMINRELLTKIAKDSIRKLGY